MSNNTAAVEMSITHISRRSKVPCARHISRSIQILRSTIAQIHLRIGDVLVCLFARLVVNDCTIRSTSIDRIETQTLEKVTTRSDLFQLVSTANFSDGNFVLDLLFEPREIANECDAIANMRVNHALHFNVVLDRFHHLNWRDFLITFMLWHETRESLTGAGADPDFAVSLTGELLKCRVNLIVVLDSDLNLVGSKMRFDRVGDSRWICEQQNFSLGDKCVCEKHWI